MPDRGGSAAAMHGYAIADGVARSPTGVLLRARRLQGGDVALKVFELDGTPEEQAYPRERLTADWRIWSELRHPHALRARDYGETRASLYVSTRWIEGPSLRDVLERRRKLDAVQVHELARQLAGALDAAASAGLVHLDVKPENVLFAPDERAIHAYMRDFGAGQLAAWRARADRSRTFGGTLEYAAPELIEGGSVDARTAVYSLGCLLYEALTGATPYAGRASKELWHAHLEEAPPPVRGVPEEVDDVFAAALAKRPDKRFATCTDLADALCSALAVAPVPRAAPAIARRRSFGIRHVAVVAAVAAVATGAATATSWLTSGSSAADPQPAKAGANRQFLAALPASKHAPAQKPVQVPAAPPVQHHAPPVRHHVVQAPHAPVTTVTPPPAATTPVAATPATVVHHAYSPPVVHRTVTPPPTTTTTQAAAPQSPPLPPSPPQDSGPPLPPPPP